MFHCPQHLPPGSPVSKGDSSCYTRFDPVAAGSEEESVKSKWGGEKAVAPRRGRWSAEEIARFRELYGLKDEATIARELNRSVVSVRNMAQQIYDRQTARTGPWTAGDMEALRLYLGASPVSTIARILGRSAEEVNGQIAELARQRKSGEWSQDDIGLLKRVFGTRSDEDLAILFGRGIEEVCTKAHGLCLGKDKAFLRRRSGGKEATRMPRWRPDELKLLQDLYPGCSNLDIAQQLGRSVKSVVSKAHHLGLRKDPSRLREMGRQNVSLRYSRRDGGDVGAAG